MKVLLVEDQAHQRELVARVLLKLGDLEVVSAENGKEAMGHLYETSDFDVVVTVSSPNCPCQRFGLFPVLFRELEVSFSGRDAA